MSTPTDPADLSATHARRMIARRQLSAAELASACIRRTQALNPAVNAIVAADFDAVMRDAAAADAAMAAGQPAGALHGLPFGVKDMVDVKGLPTTYGSELFRNNTATRDDASVAALRAAGGIAFGKTNNPEWSAGANTRNRVYGATANPYDVSRSCAGSSGGSAVALACGFVPLATGSDTGGSLRNPAAFCGVVGMRPSPGVVPGNNRQHGMIPLPTSGPMARTVADAGLMLSIMARPDRNDPYTPVTDGHTPWAPAHFANLPVRDLSGLRIAFTPDFGFAPTENIIRDRFAQVAGILAPFCGRADHATPDCTDADQTFAVLRGMMMLGAHGDRVDRHPDLVGPNVTANVHEARSFSADDIATALTRQTAYYHRWQHFFGDWDYILTPAVTISPRDWHELYPAEINGTPTRSYYHWLALAYATTLAGHPSISIPCGFDARGLPFGLQIVGRRNDDLGVLTVAQELEAIIAGIPSLASAPPDTERLKNAPPLAQSPGFMDL